MSHIALKSVFAALALFAASPSAALDVWQCQMERSNYDWIGDGLVFAHDPASRTAILADAVVASHNGGKPVTVRTRGNAPVRMRWQVRNIRTDNGILINTLVFRAKFIQSSGALSLSVEAPGHSVNLSRDGRCGRVSDADRKRFMAYIREIS